MKVKLGDYIKEYSVRNKNNEDIPVYSVTNTQGFCRDYFGKEVASKNKTTYKIVPKGYFAYNPSRVNVGSIDWQREEEMVIVSPLYNIFSVSQELDQQYLYYYLKSDITLFYIKSFVTGSVRDNLKFDMLCDFPINLPNLDEQKRIVKVLDNIRKQMELRRQQLNSFDELIKARFVEMFGQGEYPQSTISQLVSGKVSTAKKDFDTEDTIKYIDISSIDNKRNIMTGYTEYILREAPSRAQQHIRKNDIVISTVRPNLRNVAVTSYEDDNLVASSGFCILRPNKCTPEYLMAIVTSEKFTDDMVKVVTGANYPAIKDSDVMNYPVAVAPIDEQIQFADFTKQVDKSKFIN